jgi:hypothetical protein
MRLSPHALARSCAVLAAAVLTVVPGSVAVAAAKPRPVTDPRLPHVAGGFLPSAARVVPKTARLGVRANEVLPTSVDLRQYAPPPGDQGQVGSCVAWTIAYGIMGYHAKRTGGSGAPYAPLFLYLRNVAPGGAPHAGLNPDAVLANAQSAGVDTQADYWQGTTDYRTPPTPAQIANAANYRVTGWTRLFNGAGQGEPVKASIRQALAAGNPVALGIPVYRDFMSLRGHTVYNTLSGTSLGGHMMAAYGYDDAGLLVRNSWGTGWGNGGDVKLSWAFVTRIAVAAYTVSGVRTPAAPAPAPAPVPVITGLAPGTVSTLGGTAVTLAGTGLLGVTSVKVGGVPVPARAVTATSLSFTAPAKAAGNIAVTVTGRNGTSAERPLTYVAPPAPVIASVTPNSAPVNASTPVLVTGGNFTGATKVTVDGRSLAFTGVGDGTLRVTLPPHAAGQVTLSVTTPAGTSAAAAGARFTYVPLPVPAVAAVAPASGPGRAAVTVLLTGSGLRGTTKVTADGAALRFVALDDNRLQVTVPPRPAGQLTLVVTAPGGVSTAVPYTVTPSVIPSAAARAVGGGAPSPVGAAF